jgi:hypothetical protein
MSLVICSRKPSSILIDGASREGEISMLLSVVCLASFLIER